MPASSRQRSTTAGARRDVDAERFEEIGAAATARHRPVAVLRDLDAAGGNHERRDRRDVERVRAIAARATGVEHVGELPRQLRRARAHGPCEPDDLRRPLAFHRQRDEQAGDLRWLSAALHDLVHGRGGLLDGEVLTALKLLDQRGEHHISRKLRSSFRPSPVSTDSGWNCTP